MGTFLTIVQILGGLLTPIIAIIASWIAYQQWKTSRRQHELAQDKLKLDLFDQRYKVYQGLLDFIDAANIDGRPSREAFGRFYLAINPAKFLFGDDLWKYLELVRKQAADLRAAGAMIAKATEDRCETIPMAHLTQASETERELLTWFYNQPEEASKQFLPYLNFKDAL